MVMTQRNNFAETSCNSYGDKVCIPWGAIIIGAIISVSYTTLLNMLGIGLGLIIFDPERFNMVKLGHGAIAWMTLSGIISMMAGGYLVGKFSNTNCKLKRCCYGIAAWALAMSFTVMVATTASGLFMGGAINITRGSVYVVEQQYAAANAASNNQSNVLDTNTNIKKSANNIGKASVMMFLAFFLSAIAGIVSAMYTKPFTNEVADGVKS